MLDGCPVWPTDASVVCQTMPSFTSPLEQLSSSFVSSSRSERRGIRSKVVNDTSSSSPRSKSVNAGHKWLESDANA